MRLLLVVFWVVGPPADHQSPRPSGSKLLTEIFYLIHALALARIITVIALCTPIAQVFGHSAGPRPW